MQRVGIINGDNINQDYDFANLVLGIVKPGVFRGLVPTQAGGAGTDIVVPAGEAIVPVNRALIIDFIVTFNNTDNANLTIGLNKKIFIEITQANIDDANLNINSDGTGIGEIKITDAYPVGNFIKLGETDGAGLLATTVLENLRIDESILNYTDLTNLTGDITTTGDITAENVNATNGNFTTVTGDGGGLTNINFNTVSYFGDGSDGDVTITANTTLTRDMFYNNLTINPTFVLNTNGYKIYVLGTFSGTGIIRRNGNTGGDGTDAVGGVNGLGGIAGVTLNQGSLNAEIIGGNGGDGTDGLGSGNPGLAGEDSLTSFTNIDGVLGGIASTAGVSTRHLDYLKVNSLARIISYLFNTGTVNTNNLWLSSQLTGIAGSGGGGGGYKAAPQSNSFGGGGGGAGGNAGVIWISARFVNFTGTIEAIGGTGGTGGDYQVSISWGFAGSGGGGGGNGGIVYLIAETFTNIGTITLTGGLGGTGGQGYPGLGPSGQNGNTGETIQITI